MTGLWGWLPGPLRGRRKETGETGTVLCLLSGGGKEPSSFFFDHKNIANREGQRSASEALPLIIFPAAFHGIGKE